MSGEADPDLARVQQAARPIFAALGDDNRLRLVTRPYSEGPMSIVRLSHGSGLTRQAVTKHLRVLARVGLVQSARRGRESLWTLGPRPLDTARTSLDEISHQWDAALRRQRENPSSAPRSRFVYGWLS
jgi:DNA-binding transcriptional ArsR family regulator